MKKQLSASAQWKKPGMNTYCPLQARLETVVKNQINLWAIVKQYGKQLNVKTLFPGGKIKYRVPV